MRWCGTFAAAPTWQHGTFNPCQSETITAVLLIVLAAGVLFSQYRKLRIFRQLSYPGTRELTACTMLSGACLLVLVISHAVLLAISSASSALHIGLNPYNIFYEAAALAWTSAALVRPSCSGLMLARMRLPEPACCTCQTQIALCRPDPTRLATRRCSCAWGTAAGSW